MTIKLVDDNIFIDTVEGELTMNLREPDEVGPSQRCAHAHSFDRSKLIAFLRLQILAGARAGAGRLDG